MNDFAEVIYHWQKGQNKTQIAASLGISRPTVRKYLKVAQATGLTENADAATLARVLEEIAKAAKPVSQWPSAVLKSLTLHDEAIRSWLGEPDMTAKQIRRLLAEQGDVFSYSSVKRYVRKLKPGARPVTVRLETAPGEQVQVDFGQVMLQLPDTRKKVWAFVMTLSYSRHRFVRFVERQDTNTWLDCHIRAFEFFGGCPRTVLLDNLKAGVVKPDLYDPTLNQAYAELERHYGFVADPAKVRTPEHKGKVERSNRACRIGHSTLFLKSTKLFRTLNTARADGSWEKALKKLLAPDLLIIDDFGLTALTMTQAEDLYEIIAERHQRGSIIVTSNRPPGDWVTLFPDQVLANSAMDRLAHRAHHVAMKGESYRKKTRPRNPSSDN